MANRITVVVCICILLFASGISTATARQESGNQLVIQNATYRGAGVAEAGENNTYLWQSKPYNISIKIYTGNRSGSHKVCTNFKVPGNNTTSPATCHDVSFSPDTVRRINFSFSSFSQNKSGQRTNIVSVKSGGKVLTQNKFPIYTMAKSGDEDGDQLLNKDEIKFGTNITSVDTDRDSLNDYAEVVEYETDPTAPDTDDDGLRDAEEIQLGTNPNQPDTDADKLNDGEENQRGTNASAADTDGDGLTDIKEIQGDPETDPTKSDTDGDGANDSAEIGSETNPLVPDTDNDGLSDGQEIEHGTDPTSADTDGDGLGDGDEIELGTNPLDKDTDSDGLSDGLEQQFGTNPKSPIVAGGLYFLLLTVLVASVIVFQRSDSDLISRFRDDTEQQEPVLESMQTNEVVSDEDKVISHLYENGGRLPQGEIVEKTGWSKSKVSRLLSKMEGSEKITKMSIGRKNIVILYGQEPNNIPISSEDETRQ